MARMTFYLRHHWMDQRLKGSDSSKHLKVFGENSKLGLWMPDTFCVSCKSWNLIEPTGDKNLIKVMPDGSVLTSQLVQADVSCSGDLRMFPMDIQNCSIKLESCKLLLSFVRGKKLVAIVICCDKSLRSPNFTQWV